MDCEYSEWGDWEDCDKPCGGGTQKRTRNPTREGWYGCEACTTEKEKESQSCNTDQCPGIHFWLRGIKIKNHQCNSTFT